MAWTWFEFVRTESGQYLLQVYDPFRWPDLRFALTDGDKFWPGGLFVACNWEKVKSEEVPAKIRKELKKVIKAYK